MADIERLDGETQRPRDEERLAADTEAGELTSEDVEVRGDDVLERDDAFDAADADAEIYAAPSDDDADGERRGIRPLAELEDWQVADGYPDVRGWPVTGPDGVRIGTVAELLVDVGAERVRYLDVLLEAGQASSDEIGRHVQLPIGPAEVDEAGDCLVVNDLSALGIGARPPIAHAGIDASTTAAAPEPRRTRPTGEIGVTRRASPAARTDIEVPLASGREGPLAAPRAGESRVGAPELDVAIPEPDGSEIGRTDDRELP